MIFTNIIKMKLNNSNEFSERHFDPIVQRKSDALSTKSLLVIPFVLALHGEVIVDVMAILQ
jgi:hypothetical protein